MMESQEIHISWGSLWRIIAMALFLIILFIARDVLVAALLAIIISSALDPFVSFLEKRRIPRIIGTLAIYVLVIIVIALIIYIIIPIFLVELNNLINNSGDILTSISESIGASSSIFDSITTSINQFIADLSGGKTTFIGILSQLVGGVIMTLVVFVISFYLTVGRDGVEKFLTTVLPPAYHVSVLTIYDRARVKIGYWFTGQLLLSLFIGLSVFIGLSLLGVKYAFIIGIAAAALELVPYVGPIFSGALAVVAALSTSVALGIYTLLFFLVIQQFESHLLIPVVSKFTTSLNPVIVILSLLIGAQVFGLVGVILAVPVAVSFQEVFRYLVDFQKTQALVEEVNPEEV